MSLKYCLPLVESDLLRLRGRLDTALRVYDLAEVWLDYLNFNSVKDVVRLDEDYPGKLIFLFRRLRGEAIKMPIEQRKDILLSLSRDCMFDLEFNTQQEELLYLKDSNTNLKLIISHHDYDRTPDDPELTKLVADMADCDPWAVKIATYCRTKADSIRLLQLLLNMRSKNLRSIVIGMGENGVITRVFGSLWSDFITFAPEDERERTAPGQLTREELITIFEAISLK
ncbi:MAG: type I 3-dehydroquinate dehydratase [Bdellovibrionales bacterium]|nr:type I 3-dehydroquinate dehydratase [Bdellovibrionales bacterium]